LFVYSLSCVSTIDNVIKAYIIGETVRLNPLVVLITVIGAIQLEPVPYGLIPFHHRLERA
jgi:predicted PurR-regulated permease PerM